MLFSMPPLFAPLHLLLMMLAGWVNRHQLDVIEYLKDKNRVLKEGLGEQRIRFTIPNAADSLEKRKHSGEKC